MRKTTTLFYCWLLVQVAFSQNYQPCPNTIVFTDNCATACVVCGIPAPFSINNGTFTNDDVPEDCLELHNNMWFAFMAVEPQVTFTAIPSNCNFAGGIQMAMYESCTGPCITMDYGCLGVPVVVTMPDLVVGNIYLIVIDGCAGAICDVLFSVDPPSAIEIPNLNNTNPLEGPSVVCTNGTFTYCIPELFGVSEYEWTVPAGVLVNGMPGPRVFLPASSNGCAEITFGASPGPVQICVKPLNPCHQGNSQCKLVDVRRIPTTVLPPETVCLEAAEAYVLPWGDILLPTTGTNTYQNIYENEYGCDSLVKITVTVPPTPFTVLPPKGICPGECMTVGDEEYCLPGIYTQKLVSSMGCDSMIQLNFVPVNISADILPHDTFNCVNSTVTLHAIHQVSAIQTWSNSNGTILGTGDSLLLVQPGKYFLSVTRTQFNTTCTQIDTVLVPIDTVPPSVSILADTLGCGAQSAAILAISNAVSATYQWEGPGGFFASTADTTVLLPGVYSVTVTNLATGCNNSATVTVHANFAPPDLTIDTPAPLNCQTTAVPLQFHSQTAISQEWLGPNGFVSQLPQPQVGAPGLYTLTVRDSLGCSNNASVTVVGDFSAPVVSVTGDTVNCAGPTAALQAGATTPASFLWSGPGGFSATVPSPMVDTSGVYTVIATGTNGCTSSATTTVTADFSAPGIEAGSGTLSCSGTNTWIAVQSSDPAAQLNWSGPGGFQSSLPADSVSIVGTYIVSATGSNGCASSDTVQVMTDNSVPTVMVSGDTLTCARSTVVLDGSSATPGILFAWTGPLNFSSTAEDITVALPGQYSLTGTDPANGCKSVASFEVKSDTTSPAISATAGTITCAETTAVLQANSASSGLAWLWTGPNSFGASGQTAITPVPGAYMLIATNPGNGCTSSASVVVQNDTVPPAVQIAGMDTLTCSMPKLTLLATANGSVQWAWASQSGTVSTSNSIEIDAPGDYSLSVISSNGCSSTLSVAIAQNIEVPLLSASGDTIDCLSGQAMLTGQSMSPVTSWHWTGPGNFISALQATVTTTPGDYTLTAQGLNGCAGTATTTVAMNSDLPQVAISGAQALTCSTTTVTLLASISPGASGQWNTGLLDTLLTVQTPGVYTFSATAANGCKQNASVQVVQDTVPPQGVTASATHLSCNTPVSSLQGASSSGNVAWSWTGPGNFSAAVQNPANITTPGTYTLAVSNLANGCSASSSTTILADFAVPQVTATSDTLTCSQQQVVIETITGTLPVAYWWTGPGNFASTAEDPIASAPGLYTLLATAANGCTGTLNVMVAQDTAAPIATATGDTLRCSSPVGGLTGMSPAPSAAFSWTGPNSFQSFQPNPSVTQPGIYSLLVTGANGCSSAVQAIVVADFVQPALAAQGGEINCVATSIGLVATTGPGVQVVWSGPGNFQSSSIAPAVGLPGQYLVTATGLNGCTSQATAIVLADTLVPVFSIAAPGQLDCNTTELSLNAAVAQPALYTAAWSTADGHLVGGANNLSPTIDLPGTYTLQITDLENGCATVREVLVLQDSNIPSAMVSSYRHISCFGQNDGVIKIDSVKGGTKPFLFALDNGAFSASAQFGGLTPGHHVVRLLDASGCALEVDFELQEPNLLQVSLGHDTLISLGSPIALLVFGAVNDPQRVAELATSPFQLQGDSVVYPLSSFTYKLWVRDGNNCAASDEQVVLVDRHRNVYVPTVFAPGSSGQNNLLAIYGGPDVSQVKLFRIFDRWGSLVHEAKGFVPDGASGAWDGLVNGQLAAPAVYVYVAEVEFFDGEVEIFKGDVTVLR